jgi:hypothetical protein
MTKVLLPALVWLAVAWLPTPALAAGCGWYLATPPIEWIDSDVGRRIVGPIEPILKRYPNIRDWTLAPAFDTAVACEAERRRRLLDVGERFLSAHTGLEARWQRRQDELAKDGRAPTHDEVIRYLTEKKTVATDYGNEGDLLRAAVCVATDDPRLR